MSVSDQQLLEELGALYYCPESGGIEHPTESGFRTCCSAPENHVSIAERLTDLRAENERLSVNVCEMAGLNTELLLRSAAAEARAEDAEKRLADATEALERAADRFQDLAVAMETLGHAVACVSAEIGEDGCRSALARLAAPQKDAGV